MVILGVNDARTRRTSPKRSIRTSPHAETRTTNVPPHPRNVNNQDGARQRCHSEMHTQSSDTYSPVLPVLIYCIYTNRHIFVITGHQHYVLYVYVSYISLKAHTHSHAHTHTHTVAHDYTHSNTYIDMRISLLSFILLCI